MSFSFFQEEEIRDHLRILLKKEGVFTGTFFLRSGKESRYYVDVRRVSLHPDGVYFLGYLLFQKIHPLSVSAIGGPTLGADPLVTSVQITALLFGVKYNAFLVRKEKKGYGTSRLLEGPPIVPGTRVVLMEDVVTTGESLKKAVEVVQEEGGEVVHLFSVVDREEGGRETFQKLGIPYTSLFTLSELL